MSKDFNVPWRVKLSNGGCRIYDAVGNCVTGNFDIIRFSSDSDKKESDVSRSLRHIVQCVNGFEALQAEIKQLKGENAEMLKELASLMRIDGVCTFCNAFAFSGSELEHRHGYICHEDGWLGKRITEARLALKVKDDDATSKKESR